METTNEGKKSILETFFKLSENNTDVKTEILAGFTTFITVAYALLVIPNILKFSGMNAAGVTGDCSCRSYNFE
jgi:AGZA family xanthine/uracil permease-like MFS transporter